MDNDFHLSSVLNVDEQILMPIATMGAGHLHHHHHHETQEQQQPQPAELDAGLHVNNSNNDNSVNSDETATLTTTHLDSCGRGGAGGGGIGGIGVGGETASNSYGSYFTENHNINTLHPNVASLHPPEELPADHRPHEKAAADAKDAAVAENKEVEDKNEKISTEAEVEGEEAQVVVDGDRVNEEPVEDIDEEVEEEEVEDVEPDAGIEEEEEITPDIGNIDVALKKETPEEIIPDEGDTTPTPNTTNDIINHDNDANKVSQSESEQPMSSTRASQRKGEEVDENQCRVCCSKEDLVSIFKKIEGYTGAEMLMVLCPSVSIAVKDFLPQFVCHICMGKIMLAIKLKQQVETTEKELRKKLSRHKNKVRRPAGYVVISAPLDSDTDSDDEANDEEFKVSDVASATPSEDSDSSESSGNKKKRTRGRKRRKSAVTPTLKSKTKSGKSENGSSGNDDDGDPIGNHKRKRSSNSSPETFACDVCEQIFTRKQSLILHKKVHDTDREPIACRVCGKKFKVKGAYRTHMEKHRSEAQPYKCQKCSRKFASSGELKDHMEEEHQQWYECLKCKRKFVSSGRLKKHKQGHCPGMEMGRSKKAEVETFVVGKDLFKSVAPLTTTYWSDSFSD